MSETENSPLLDEQRLTGLGLERQPFTDDGFVFVDDDLETRLNIALGLLQKTAGIVVITGESGVGKTTFLRHLASQESGLAFTGVSATVELRLADILRKIGATSGHSMKEATIRLIRESEQRIVLAIDNAENLRKQTLVQLAALQTQLGIDGLEFPIVLTCERQMSGSVMAALTRPSEGESHLHEMVIGGLDADQTRRYLSARLSRAGGDPALLNDRQRRRIHERSGGAPALINAEAAHVLDQGSGIGLPAWNGERTRLAVVVAVPVLAVALAALWLLGGSDEAPSDTAQIVRNEPAPGASSTNGRESEPLALPEEKREPRNDTGNGGGQGSFADGSSRDAIANGTGSDAGNTNSGTGDTGTTTNDSTPATTPLDVAENSGTQDGAPTGSDGTATDTDTADIPSEAESTDNGTAGGGATASRGDEREPSGSTETAGPESPDTDANGEQTADAQWLQSRDASRYTIQVLGAYEQATVDRFLNQVSGDERLHMAVLRRQDRDWHVLITGDYADAASARRALNGLPDKWRANGAFPRSFGSLTP